MRPTPVGEPLPLEPAAAPRRRVLAVVALVCFLLQLASATWWVGVLDTPNISTNLARNLVENGVYEGGQFKLKGPGTGVAPGEYRRYHLPGGPLYLAAAFRFLPPALDRYAHLPVTVLLITSVAAAACALGGPGLGLLAGLLGALQPFVVRHGPVWDDTFLAAALVWLIVALLVSRRDTAGRPSRARLALLGAAALGAALTRQESQLMLALASTALLLLPSLRGFRREGAALLAGLLIAVAGWGLRNRWVSGEFVIGASRDGITLWEWNNPRVRDALRSGSPEVLSFKPEIMRPHWDRTSRMTENDVNRYYLALVFDYLWRNPIDALATSLSKLLLSLTGLATDKPVFGARNLVVVAANLVLFAFAARGLYLIKIHASAPLAGPLALAIALPVFLGLLVGPVGMRYRIAFDGILWIAAAAAILPRLPRLSRTALA